MLWIDNFLLLHFVMESLPLTHCPVEGGAYLRLEIAVVTVVLTDVVDNFTGG